VLADHSKLDQAPFSYWTPLDRDYRLITDEPRVDVTYPQFAQSVIPASTPVTTGASPRAGGSATRTPEPKSETVGGAAHHGRRGS
jgi:hypothetical protein